MPPQRFLAEDIAAVLPTSGFTLVQGCSGESTVLADAVMQAGAAIGQLTFSGIFVGGLNRRTYLANPGCRVRTFFLTPELKQAVDQVDFLPFCYADVLANLASTNIEAAIFTVSPPDENGICSFGPVVDFLAYLWPRIPIKIAQINASMPRTRGYPGIPFDQITAFIEQDTPLLSMPVEPADEVSAKIASYVEGFVGDGATLQTGLGKVPASVLRSLSNRKGLRIHSGLIGDGVLDLLEAGALAPGASITVGVAIGSEALYQSAVGETFNFQPVSVTHDAAVIARIPNFVALNSAIEVDLFGQSFAEVGPRGFMSGPGGASDFARGAKAGGGLRVVALPSSARGKSRIVAPGAGLGPVSLGRMDTDVVVTEHGAADLRGLGHAGRAAALIAIAAPEHRDLLAEQWNAYARGM